MFLIFHKILIVAFKHLLSLNMYHTTVCMGEGDDKVYIQWVYHLEGGLEAGTDGELWHRQVHGYPKYNDFCGSG